jgi:peroxiredoxin
MNLKIGVLAAVVLGFLAGSLSAEELDPRVEAFWVLMHEPAVLDELKLTEEQQSRFLPLRDGWDARFFPLRNKGADVARPAFASLVGEMRAALEETLDERQQKRLFELELRRLGTDSFVQPEVEAALRLTDPQKERIRAIIAETGEALKQANAKAREEKAARRLLEGRLKSLKVSEQKKVLERLTAVQRAGWAKLVGEPFDVDRLGRPSFRAPDLIDSGKWINSEGISPADLRGKVAVIHFYACGCINCIHNYPAYLDWQSRFRGQDVVMVGIHTPETLAERDIEKVKEKAAAEKFEFPVLIDVESKNWDAWGNSIWPTVYVVDRRGRLRAYWTGELNWEGATGEAQMRKRIEELLAEPRP